MATVKDVWNLLDRKAPFRTQMDFDNAGFLVGRGDQQVTRVLVALDITPEVIREAAEKGCQLILAHHPVIWGKVGQITDETATGRKVLALIEQGIAAICAHTNLDAAGQGDPGAVGHSCFGCRGSRPTGGSGRRRLRQYAAPGPGHGV